MDTKKANQLRRLVEAEIAYNNGFGRTQQIAYWKGVRETLFTVLQLNSSFDMSKPEDLLENLRATQPHHGDV